jgi:hypothetical protein
VAASEAALTELKRCLLLDQKAKAKLDDAAAEIGLCLSEIDSARSQTELGKGPAALGQRGAMLIATLVQICFLREHSALMIRHASPRRT